MRSALCCVGSLPFWWDLVARSRAGCDKALIFADFIMGTSKNSRYRSAVTKLPANDSASLPFRFINVHCRVVRDWQRKQFFEVPGSHKGKAVRQLIRSAGAKLFFL